MLRSSVEIWCPVCAGNRKLELKDLRKLARERGGKCLSREYMNGCAAYLGVQTWTQVESGGRAGKGRFIQKRNLVPQMLRPAPSFSPCRHDRADEEPGEESRRKVSVPELSGLSDKTSVEMWAGTPMVRSTGKYQTRQLVSILCGKSQARPERLSGHGCQSRR